MRIGAVGFWAESWTQRGMIRGWGKSFVLFSEQKLLRSAIYGFTL